MSNTVRFGAGIDETLYPLGVGNNEEIFEPYNAATTDAENAIEDMLPDIESMIDLIKGEIDDYLTKDGGNVQEDYQIVISSQADVTKAKDLFLFPYLDIASLNDFPYMLSSGKYVKLIGSPQDTWVTGNTPAFNSSTGLAIKRENQDNSWYVVYSKVDKLPNQTSGTGNELSPYQNSNYIPAVMDLVALEETKKEKVSLNDTLKKAEKIWDRIKNAGSKIDRLKYNYQRGAIDKVEAAQQRVIDGALAKFPQAKLNKAMAALGNLNSKREELLCSINSFYEQKKGSLTKISKAKEFLGGLGGSTNTGRAEGETFEQYTARLDADTAKLKADAAAADIKRAEDIKQIRQETADIKQAKVYQDLGYTVKPVAKSQGVLDLEAKEAASKAALAAETKVPEVPAMPSGTSIASVAGASLKNKVMAFKVGDKIKDIAGSSLKTMLSCLDLTWAIKLASKFLKNCIDAINGLLKSIKALGKDPNCSGMNGTSVGGSPNPPKSCGSGMLKLATPTSGPDQKDTGLLDSLRNQAKEQFANLKDYTAAEFDTISNAVKSIGQEDESDPEKKSAMAKVTDGVKGLFTDQVASLSNLSPAKDAAKGLRTIKGWFN